MATTMGRPHHQHRHPRSRIALRRRSSGFSLTELVLVSALSAALLGLAIPSMSDMLQSQRIRSGVGSLVSALHFARSEAIKRNGRAVVCKSAAGSSCTKAGGWEQGWIVFHDRNNNAVFDAGEPLIQQQGALADGLRMSGNQPVANYVSYSANGTAKLVSGAFQAGTITLCPLAGNKAEARKIVLSGTGRPRTYRGSAADCG